MKLIKYLILLITVYSCNGSDNIDFVKLQEVDTLLDSLLQNELNDVKVSKVLYRVNEKQNLIVKAGNYTSLNYPKEDFILNLNKIGAMLINYDLPRDNTFRYVSQDSLDYRLKECISVKVKKSIAICYDGETPHDSIKKRAHQVIRSIQSIENQHLDKDYLITFFRLKKIKGSVPY